MSTFVAFLTDETGASAAEYVLILAIIGSGIAVAAKTFGTSISSALGSAGTAMTNVAWP
jgi:pilus assembly protein Flp/PilA